MLVSILLGVLLAPSTFGLVIPRVVQTFESNIATINDTYVMSLGVGSANIETFCQIDLESDEVIIAPSKNPRLALSKHVSLYSKTNQLTNGSLISNFDGRIYQPTPFNGTLDIGEISVVAKLTNFSMSLDNNKDTYIGIVGLGPDSSLLNSLKAQGDISSASFSLYYDKKNSLTHTSSIQFGEIVDFYIADGHEMFELPLNRTTFTVKGLKFGSEEITDDEFPATISASSPAIKVPSSLYPRLKDLYGESSNTSDKNSVECYDFKSLDSMPSFEFEFDDGEIEVPFRNLAVHSDSEAVGESSCYFGIEDSGSEKFVLGTSFLNAAYININYDEEKIRLAQAKLTANLVMPTMTEKYKRVVNLNGFADADEYLNGKIVEYDMKKHPVESWNFREYGEV